MCSRMQAAISCLMSMMMLGIRVPSILKQCPICTQQDCPSALNADIIAAGGTCLHGACHESIVHSACCAAEHACETKGWGYFKIGSQVAPTLMTLNAIVPSNLHRLRTQKCIWTVHGPPRHAITTERQPVVDAHAACRCVTMCH